METRSVPPDISGRHGVWNFYCAGYIWRAERWSGLWQNSGIWV